MELYGMTIHSNRLDETIRMNGHTIWFALEMKKFQWKIFLIFWFNCRPWNCECCPYFMYRIEWLTNNCNLFCR